MLPLCVALLLLPPASTTPDTFSTTESLIPDAFPTTASLIQESLQLPEQRRREHWRTGGMVMQGFIGANLFDTVMRSGGSTPDVDGSGEDAAQLPTIGGGAQWKLGGSRIDFALEAMFAFSWRSNATAIAVGGGGAAVAVDVDMYLFEIYGGPVANIFLNDRTRAYVSAGPVMEWANYDQGNYAEGIDDNGSGFGTGWYARTGIEFGLADRTMIGLGVRWSDSTIDLDNGLGDLDLEGFQVALTVTQGF